MSCPISILPSHVLQIIFCQLPTATLVRCRYVCKSWRQILEHPDFAKIYRGGFSNLLVTIEKVLMPSSSNSKNLNFLEPKGGSVVVVDKGVVFEGSSELSADLLVENSCKGLLCLCSNIHGSVNAYNMWILNPLTGEYIILPPYTDDQNTQYFYRCALGFCPNTNQYKVLRMFYNRQDIMEAEVYTLGSDNWRNIGVVPQYNVRSRCNWKTFTKVLDNGSIHWVITEGNRSRIQPIQICAFDCEVEEFRSLALPPIFQEDNLDYCLLDVGVFRDFLCIYCHHRLRSSRAEIWLMKEYGIEGSWIKMLDIDFQLSHLGPSELKVVELLENGNVLLILNKKTLFLYKSKTKRIVKVDNAGAKFSVSPFVLSKPSFTSLEDVVGHGSSVLKGFTWDR